MGGVGVGVTVKVKDVDSISMSQNIPVNPAKQSHMIVSFSRSMHTPLVQLTKSQSETGGEGVGEINTELAGMVLVAMVENGRSKLSELEMKNKIDDEVVMADVVGVMIRDGVLNDGGGSKMSSQKSPVNPAKH
jgi:hypothetical protein